MILDMEDLLLPGTKAKAPAVTFRWAWVTQDAPLRIRLDGEPEPLQAEPESLVPGLQVGDRVWVQFHGLMMIILGVSA